MASSPTASEGARDILMEELMHRLMQTPGHQHRGEMLDVCSNEYGVLTYSSHYTFVPHDAGCFMGRFE